MQSCRSRGRFCSAIIDDMQVTGDSTVARGFRQIREWLALVATLVLLAHTVAAGIVDGAMASPQLLDVFGNVICTTHGAEKTPGGPLPANQSHLPACCFAGCSVAGGHSITGPIVPVLAAPDLAWLEFATPRRQAPLRHAAWSPLNPRAPPFAI